MLTKLMLFNIYEILHKIFIETDLSHTRQPAADGFSFSLELFDFQAIN